MSEWKACVCDEKYVVILEESEGAALSADADSLASHDFLCLHATSLQPHN